jgi:serine/threonine protein phosphatase PrpC
MSLEVDIGHASRRGPREINEDFAGAVRAGPADPGCGLIAAIADGVSGHAKAGGRGLEAAQTTVMGLLADFFATPRTWETTVALDRLIGAQNAWLVAQNRQREGVVAEGVQAAAALTTLTALVLQGQSYALAHIGDTRLWRLAGEELQLLTHDHAMTHPDQRSRLTRCVGLDDMVRVDYLQGEARVGDCFVLTSDGVHGVLKPRKLAALAREGTAQQASEALVDAAIAAGGQDNATALVVRVLGLDAARLEDETVRLAALPALGRKRPGEQVDGYAITALVADTGVHRLYQARDPKTQQLVVLKALHESRAADAQERAMLAHEAWLGMRVTERDARGFVRVHDRPGATALYTVFDWHAGRTLDQQLTTLRQAGRRATVVEVVAGLSALARALGRLHRQGVVHRDIKPSNLHLGDDGEWRIFDLGVAISGRESAAARELHAGTPSYMNPEQWDGAGPDAGSDLYALGVTAYQWLGGRLPHGEIEPYQTARYKHDPTPLSRLRHDVPIWLDHLVQKAIAREADQRFETAEELLLALDRGAARTVSAPAATPLVARDAKVLWQIGLGVSLLANLLLVYWLLFLPR